MTKHLQKGSTDITGIVILVIVILIMLASPRNPDAEPFSSSTGWNWTTGTTITSAGSIAPRSGAGGDVPGTPVPSSNYSSGVSIGTGNAPYSYQSYEEYVTIENRGRDQINITGWQFKNGKDERSYPNSLQRFSADIAIIPQGTLLISPSGNSFMQDIVLKSGEKAIVTTGSIHPGSPYRVTAFKEDMCTGYIESLPDHSFTPPLNSSCPRPELEPGVENLDIECRNFVRNLSSCRVPEFTTLTSEGKNCNTCVNGKLLSSSCVAFIKEHFNYRGCVANHSNKPNFQGRTWRVFLGRGWEMWASEYETIELYDRLGQLVDYQNY